MTENSKDRLHDVFFYGLYMDPVILKERKVEPRNARIAKVSNYVLRVGKRATILREQGKDVYGIVYSLTHAEIHALYHGVGLTEYAAEALLAEVNGEKIAVLCSILIDPPETDESNPEYEEKLAAVMEKLGIAD